MVRKFLGGSREDQGTTATFLTAKRKHQSPAKSGTRRKLLHDLTGSGTDEDLHPRTRKEKRRDLGRRIKVRKERGGRCGDIWGEKKVRGVGRASTGRGRERKTEEGKEWLGWK